MTAAAHRCDTCGTTGHLEVDLEVRTVDGVCVTVCRSAGPCIQRARTAGTWAGTR